MAQRFAMTELFCVLRWMIIVFYACLGVLILYLACKPSCRVCVNRYYCPRRRFGFLLVRKPWCVVAEAKLKSFRQAKSNLPHEALEQVSEPMEEGSTAACSN